MANPTTSVPVGASHNVFVTILGEFIGVAILAVIADSSEDLGKVAVMLMAGWFLIFLMVNAPLLSQLEKKL